MSDTNDDREDREEKHGIAGGEDAVDKLREIVEEDDDEE